MRTSPRILVTTAGLLVAGAVGGLMSSGLSANAAAPLTDKTLYNRTDIAFAPHSPADAADGAASQVVAVKVSAPAAGQAVVTFSSQLWVDFPNTTTSSTSNTLNMGFCSSPATIATASCGTGVQQYWDIKSPNTTGTDHTVPFTNSAMLSFTGKQDKYIYLNVATGSYQAALWSGGRATISFTPKNAIKNGSTVGLKLFN